MGTKPGEREAQRMLLVARFELAEALRSRLAVIVLALYGVGAAFGSWLFIKAFASAEGQARRILVQEVGIPEHAIAPEAVREKALSLLAAAIEDPALSEKVLSMAPLSLFYGYVSMPLVVVLVLMTSASTVSSDLSSGSARFVLFRCSRLSWVLGKWLGHAGLLGVGLLLGAGAASMIGMLEDPYFDAETPLWLLRTSFQSWLYGCSYLAIFFGIAQVVRSPMVARGLCLFAIVVIASLHGLSSVEQIVQTLPFVEQLALLLPPTHKLALWSPVWSTYLGGVLGLAVAGAGSFFLGYRWFSRRDA